jgi:hypothetical protein
MPEITIRHELECDEDTYWKCVFSDDYNRKLYKDTLKFPGYELVDQKDDEQKIVRKVHVDPPTGSMPAAVKKVIGDKLSWIEEGTFTKATHRYEFSVVPSTMADKIKNRGTLWTEKLDGQRCVRLAKISVEVKVFMVGSIIEEKLIADLRASYETAAKFTNEYAKTAKL